MTEAATTGVIERITGLDVVRGFAVMGILAMNIVYFAMPENAYISPLAWGEGTSADIATWAANFLIFDSKMRGLFSMMFGASTLLVIERGLAAGRSAEGAHYPRMLVLALFGLAHFFLIWQGDILWPYAVMGMLAFAFRKLSIKALCWWGAGFIAFNMLFIGAQFALLDMADQPGMPAELAEARAGVVESFAPGSEASAEEVRIHRAGYTTMVSHGLREDTFTPLTSLLMFGPETLGLMLIGMALFKSGLLRGTWSLERLDKWRNIGLAIGLVGNGFLLWWQFAGGLQPLTLLNATLALSVPFDVPMAIGYAALFMGLAQRYADSGFIARVAAAGRAAFTNYLGTSILMTFIFYGWGLGLYGSVSRPMLYLFVLGAWALMLLWSKPWLERFHYGPLEWLWRSLARGRMEPMRR